MRNVWESCVGKIHPGEKWFVKLPNASTLTSCEITGVTEFTVEFLRLDSYSRLASRYKTSDIEFVERYA